MQQLVQLLTDTIYDAGAMLEAVVRNSGESAEFIASCMPCNLAPPQWTVLHRIDVPPPPGAADAANASSALAS